MRNITERILHLVTVVLFISFVVGCTGGMEPDVVPGPDEAPNETPGMVDVCFYVGEHGSVPTKIINPATTGESQINRWALLLVKSGENTVYRSYTSTTSSGINVIIPAGTYTAYAVVNYPSSGTGAFTPVDGMSVSELTGHVSDLSDNAIGSLVMFGSKSISLVVGDNPTQTISVVRLVAKLGIKNISVDLSGKDFGSNIQFEISRIFVSNIYLTTMYGSDYSVAQMQSSTNWHNRMGYSSSLSYDTLLCQNFYSSLVWNNSGWGQQKNADSYFYCYQNQVLKGSDSTSSTWSKRCSRIVIEAVVSGGNWSGVYYYPITVASTQKGILRNNTYVADLVTITNLGSTDPEGVNPGACSVTWATDTDDWSGPYLINENS